MKHPARFIQVALPTVLCLGAAAAPIRDVLARDVPAGDVPAKQ
jgi:hypothetical protein